MQGGVSNSTESHDSSMDGTAGVTSAAAAESQSKPGTASGVVTVVSDATPTAGKPGTTDVQTLNGSAVVMNCHITGGGPADSHDAQPTVTLVNNGPVSVSKESTAVLSGTPSTIIRTTLSAQNAVTSSVISSQSSVKPVPTVTLVRPPMQTNTSQSAGNPATVLTSPAVSVTSTAGSGSLVSKTVLHTLASTVTTATVRSPTVVQNVRTPIPSTIAATPPGGVRAIAPQMLAPRLTQPQQNTPNIQNIQLPPGNLMFYIVSSICNVFLS